MDDNEPWFKTSEFYIPVFEEDFWHDECFRNWFQAKFALLLQNISDDLFSQIIVTIFVNHSMVYLGNLIMEFTNALNECINVQINH